MKQTDPRFPAKQHVKCSHCFEDVAVSDGSVDHIVAWKEYCSGATTRRELEERYHDLDNLIVVHNNCNSSAGDADMLIWLQGQARLDIARAPDGPVPLSQRIPATSGRSLDGALARIGNTGVSGMGDVSASRRGMLLQGISEQIAPDLSVSAQMTSHLMGNGRITSALGAWGEADDAMSDGDQAMEGSPALSPADAVGSRDIRDFLGH